MVVDEATAFVKSFNWATKNLTETRDYAVVTSHRREVREIADCFDADWHRQSFDPGDGSKLVWCVAAVVGSINLAPGSLDGRRELAIDVRDDDVVEHSRRSCTTTGSTRTPSISPTRGSSATSRIAPTLRGDWASSRSEPGRAASKSERRAFDRACNARVGEPTCRGT